MSYNEEATRYYLIDPVLREKGYDDISKLKLETPAPVEAIGHKGRRRAGGGRTDYLICVQTPNNPKPLPVGVIEAKREDSDPLKGMQQAKGYAECTRFSIEYVFATNGHLYGEYAKSTGIQSGPHSLKDQFPTHTELTQRYAKNTGIDISKPESALLFAADSKAYPKTRYYQDAAIRACFEKILRCERQQLPCRVLLALATGSGKTVIAANLLWRLHEVQRLPKPALFLCDRDELREQGYNKLSAVFGGAARIVNTSKGDNNAKNARIHIATYQTLGLDDEDAGTASFLTEHYPPDAFSVIIIDECHRSAWGRWSEVLLRNPNAVQIGLTATPRQLRESKNQCKDDAEITANNLKYFGQPVYEYTLIQAQEDGYLAACEIVKRKASIDGRTFTSEDVLNANPTNAKTGGKIASEEIKDQYTKTHFDNQLLIPERVAAMCKDLFQQLCQHGGPEQKVISDFSWTVDFAARRAKAQTDMLPFLDEVKNLTEELLPLKEDLKALKKDKADKAKIATTEEAIKAKEKAIREAQNKASDIDAAVFDLKAVNPNVKAVTDARTVQQIIDNINLQGEVVARAMANLRGMVSID